MSRGVLDVLRSIKPDLNTLAPIGTRGFVVTARAAAPQLSGYDYVLRFFGPRVSIPEDMVTGTAHCALAPYWRDKFADGRTTFTAFQASPRGGLVSVRIEGDRVMIGGKAVTETSLPERFAIRVFSRYQNRDGDASREVD